MKERKFIEKNKNKWIQFEELYSSKEKRKAKKNLEELSDLFIQITDDLAYARTNYPNRSVRVYLNKLAGSVFMSIYDTKSASLKRVKEFWVSELPSIIYHCRKDLYLSLTVFLLSVLIGVFSTHLNPDFTREILGNSYVEMTLENIKKNDPMAVYKGQNEFSMFLGITLNNIMVAFRTFLFGIFFLVGTLAILLYNGVMLGTFQYFFFQHNLLWESALTIWLHGTIEILSIIIAGGAGLVMGRGFIFPGTLTRWQSFQLSAKKGIKIMIGIVPLFITAGFIEGFITRHTDVNPIIKLVFILLCLGFMLFYFVYLPYKRRHISENLDSLERFEESTKLEVDRNAIVKTSKIISNTFRLITENFIKWFLLILGVSLGVSIIFVSLFKGENYNTVMADEFISQLNPHMYLAYFLFAPNGDFTLKTLYIIGISFVVSGVSSLIDSSFNSEKRGFFSDLTSSLFIRVLVLFGLLFSIFLIEENIIKFFLFLLIPIAYQFIVVTYYDKDKGSVQKIWDNFGASMPRVYGLSIVVGLIGIVLYIIVSFLVVQVVVEQLLWFFTLSSNEHEIISAFASSFLTSLSILFVCIMFHFVNVYVYFSNNEKNTAIGLKEKLKKLFP